MRDRTFWFALFCVFAPLGIAFFVDSDWLAWRLCGATIVCTVGLCVGDIWLDLWKCRHPNLYEKKWITEEGAPMIRQWCPNCNFHRYGQEEIT